MRQTLIQKPIGWESGTIYVLQIRNYLIDVKHVIESSHLNPSDQNFRIAKALNFHATEVIADMLRATTLLILKTVLFTHKL